MSQFVPSLLKIRPARGLRAPGPDALRAAAALPLLVLYLLLPGLAPADEPRKLLVAFFHEETCPSCEGYVRAQDLAARVVRLGQKDARVSAEAYSLLGRTGQLRFVELRERVGGRCAEAWAPLLIVGERCVTGYDAIDAALRELESGAGLRTDPGAVAP